MIRHQTLGLKVSLAVRQKRNGSMAYNVLYILFCKGQGHTHFEQQSMHGSVFLVTIEYIIFVVLSIVFRCTVSIH